MTEHINCESFVATIQQGIYPHQGLSGPDKPGTSTSALNLQFRGKNFPKSKTHYGGQVSKLEKEESCQTSESFPFERELEKMLSGDQRSEG